MIVSAALVQLADVRRRRSRCPVEELSVVGASLRSDWLEQRLVTASAIDPGCDLERVLKGRRLAGCEDLLPLGKSLQAAARRIPDGEVLRIWADPPRSSHVE